MTWYKGWLYSASMLGTTQIEAPPMGQVEVIPPTPPKSGSKLKANRFSGFSWSIGGLSNYKLDILKSWMIPLQLEVLTVQDTRWGFSGDWMDDHFAYIHSGSTALSGGVLTIVRRSFCSLERISWRELKEGRVLYMPSSIDILNVYQFAWSTQDSQCLSNRTTFVITASRVHRAGA